MARKLYATADLDGGHTLWRGKRGLIYEKNVMIDVEVGYWNAPIHENNARALNEDPMTPADFRRIFGTALAPGSGPVEVVLRGEVVGK